MAESLNPLVKGTKEFVSCWNGFPLTTSRIVKCNLTVLIAYNSERGESPGSRKARHVKPCKVLSVELINRYKSGLVNYVAFIKLIAETGGKLN